MLRREPTQRVRNLEKKKKAGQCYPKSKQASQAGRKSIFIQLPAAGILPSQYSTPWLGKNGKQGRCLQQGVWDIPGERTERRHLAKFLFIEQGLTVLAKVLTLDMLWLKKMSEWDCSINAC